MRCHKIARNDRPNILQTVDKGLRWPFAPPRTIAKPRIIGDGDWGCRIPSMANPPVHNIMCFLRSSVDLPRQAYVFKNLVEGLPAWHWFLDFKIEKGRVIAQVFVGQGRYRWSPRDMQCPLHQTSRWLKNGHLVLQLNMYSAIRLGDCLQAPCQPITNLIKLELVLPWPNIQMFGYRQPF